MASFLSEDGEGGDEARSAGSEGERPPGLSPERGVAAQSGAPADQRTSPRAALAATLAGHVTELLAGGDLEGAKVASDALARLLGSTSGAGEVVDLEVERRRRGGR